jgi:hypothetical protein
MGLDWIPGPKPRAGSEFEFAQIEASLKRWFCFGRKRKQARLEELSVDTSETLGAPVVGVDEAANVWARENFDHRTNRELTLESWLAKLAGLRVVALAAPCDGLPRYTNGGPGQYIGSESFRAQFLKDCTEIIGSSTFDSCYVAKNAAECVSFGAALRERARSYAIAKSIDLTRVDDAEDPDSEEFRVSVVLSAARWCEYWGRAGHGLVPWF